MHLDLHHTLTYTSNLTVYRLSYIYMLQHSNIVVPIMNT